MATAKWKIVNRGRSFMVCSGEGFAFAAEFNSAVFPDAEQRAERLAQELNERERPKWTTRGTYVAYAGSICGQFWSREDAEGLAEKFVDLMNREEQ